MAFLARGRLMVTIRIRSRCSTSTGSLPLMSSLTAQHYRRMPGESSDAWPTRPGSNAAIPGMTVRPNLSAADEFDEFGFAAL